MPEQEPPKLIIDTDWKSQAQAEKEKLSEQAAAKVPSPEAGPAGGPGVPGEPGRPVQFKDLMSLMISQALMYMGAYPDQQTGQAVVALDLARFHIDLLAILEEKTKGNLDENESKLLTRALNELRLEYVEVAKAVARAYQEGRIGKGPGAMPPAGAPGPGLVGG